MYIQDTGSKVHDNGTHVDTEYWITGTGKWNTCTYRILDHRYRKMEHM